MNSKKDFLRQLIGMQWIYIVAILLEFGSKVYSLDFPDNIGPIDLTNEMWQILSDNVKSVFVGPDDRIWYLLDHPARKEDLPHVYQILREQFFKDSPQLYGISPALFETNGRVWFITLSRTVIIGYDGHKLIERTATNGQWFAGTCYNHGRTSPKYTSDNIQFGQNIFFPGNCGVHWFNGTDWEYKEFSTESKPIILRLDPDRQFLYACIHDDSSRLEVWICCKR